MDSTIQIITMLIIVAATVTSVVSLLIVRRHGKQPLRPLGAYALLPSLTSQTIESARPLHLSLGSAAIGGQQTLLALAGAEFLYEAARQVAIGDAPPIFTVSEPSALPLAADTLRRAFTAQRLRHRFDASQTRWLPAGHHSLAYAAAVSAMTREDRTGAHIMVGSFGSELALIMDAAYRGQQPVVAMSDDLSGQAVAYGLADASLTGEELFVASAYLGDAPSGQALALTLDALRWLLIVAILVLAAAPAVLSLLGQ